MRAVTNGKQLKIRDICVYFICFCRCCQITSAETLTSPSSKLQLSRRFHMSLYRAICQTIGHRHDDRILSMRFESFFEKFPFFVAVSQLVDRVQPVEAVQTSADQKDTALSVFKHSYAIYNVLLLLSQMDFPLFLESFIRIQSYSSVIVNKFSKHFSIT